MITAAGTVARREPGNVNPDLPTGEVELAVAGFELLGDADTPPFPVDDEGPVDELTRLRHRALDLRRAQPRDRLLLRDRVAQVMRRKLDELDFVEIETPILTRSTPEGARDYLVPSRVNRGSFYALPQSPQLFKQLLMVAGFERYYQLARAFRDEDPRADRQPEFTQLDLEMSFVEEDDVIAVMETVMTAVFEATGFDAPPAPWPRVPYDEAVARYGLDRPNRRFGLEIEDVSDAVAGSEFQVFAKALEAGGVVRAINAGAHELPRSALDELTEQAKGLGAKGLVWAYVEEGGGWRSPIAKFLSDAEVAALDERLGASAGDLLLAVADDAAVAARVLGVLRLELAERLELVAPGAHDLLWVVDFPMFAWNAGEERWDPLHHPFTAPAGDLDDPGALRSRAYDLVLDGFEIGGGSIRIHDPEVQRRVLAMIGIGAEERPGALRLPARRPALRRAPARRHRDGVRSHRRAAGRPGHAARGQHPRGHHVSQDGNGRRPADRGPRAGRRTAAARAGAACAGRREAARRVKAHARSFAPTSKTLAASCRIRGGWTRCPALCRSCSSPCSCSARSTCSRCGRRPTGADPPRPPNPRRRPRRRPRRVPAARFPAASARPSPRRAAPPASPTPPTSASSRPPAAAAPRLRRRPPRPPPRAQPPGVTRRPPVRRAATASGSPSTTPRRAPSRWPPG